MRPAIVLVGLAVLVVTSASAQPAPAPATVPGEAVFVISGRGYGHGVGMSQYGAYGMANEGYSYKEILAHYYTGTTLGRAGKKEVRVLLAEGRRAVTIASSAPFTVVDATGTTHRIPAGPLAVRGDLELQTAIGPLTAQAPLIVRPGKAALLALDGREYRGRLDLSLQGGFLRIVNTVVLEGYLQGVVSGEVPHTWPLEALKAQAVAARSYALASLVKGKPFDLYSDVRSQVYLGVAGEKPRTSAAVRETAGQVVLFEGKVATTFYFSTSGGRTASAADVFGLDLPYLVSRPDPWDKASPYHRWDAVILGARTVQSKLDLDARVLDATGVSTPSGRLRSITLQTTAGATTLPASVVRTALGLRSTWITIGVLRLDRPRIPVVYGSRVRISGLARGLPSPVLASSPDGAAWSGLGDLSREANGLASFVVKPLRTMRYRMEARGATSTAQLVHVAPRVQLVRSDDPGALEGSVKPALPGAPVTIERLVGTAWTAVADAAVDKTGTFTAAVGVVRGSYRARVAPTNGYAEGVTPVLAVSP